MTRRPPRVVALLTALLLAAGLCASASAAPRHRTRQRVRQRGKADRSPLFQRGRTIDPNHPLRRQVNSEALLNHTLAVIGGADIATLPRHVRKALSKKMAKNIRSLRKAKVQGKLLDKLRNELGDTRYEQIIGTKAVGLKLAAQKLDDQGYYGREPDSRDMHRGWGWRLLPKNDKAFTDPTFLSRILRESGQTGTGHWVENDPTRADQIFENAWKDIAPKNSRPVAYTLTGSDANNLVQQIANQSAGGGYGSRVQHAKILTFADMYVAGRGHMNNQSFVVGDGRRSDNVIDSPHTNVFRPTGAEAKRVGAIEKRALKQIREKVEAAKKTNQPVGALMIEPIVGAKGAYVFRPAFLRKVRALCDELKIPIVADEILTGGGRTGKFFAYEHYKGFEPDFVTFGKGLQVAGIAEISRGRNADGSYPPRHSLGRTMTTQKASSGSMLKGAQVLKRIKDGNLIKNAEKVGKYFLAKLKELDPPRAGGDSYHPAPQGARGVGLLLASDRAYDLGVKPAMGRLMPYLTITKAEVDALFAQAKKRGRR